MLVPLPDGLLNSHNYLIGLVQKTPKTNAHSVIDYNNLFFLFRYAGINSLRYWQLNNLNTNYKKFNFQVMQFGRIDGNAYTLDFQYPFSALQAFAVALANVTQRLK